MSAGEFFKFTARTYPLHPLTLLLLPHVFRRFGQNERSLFSFLSSDDPHSLSAFLRGHRLSADSLPWLRPHHLYDYVTATLGSTLYAHPTAKLWSETQEALFRLRDRDPMQAALVKTIGLLNVLGEQTRALPSRDVLRFALAEKPDDTQAVDEALDTLQRATLITYRQFKKAYRLYEGSDIDIDARLREARPHFALGADAVALAERLETHPPLVARRHSYETGTLRFFETRCCRAEALEAEAGADGPKGGGRLLLCLAADGGEKERACETTRAVTRPDVLVGVTTETDALHEAALAVECLLWVQAETPELRNDRVATREVRERLQEATNAFRAEWTRLMRPQAWEDGEAGAGEAASWFHEGRAVPLATYRELQSLVSRACDRTYPDTPRLLNELVNRRQISSTATSARRTLLEAMIMRRGMERLNIKGFPPEASMYVSLLESTGIHRPGKSGCEFGPPSPGRDPALDRVWQEIETFLFDESGVGKSLPALNARLQAPPYGLADGILPVLLCAALLCHKDEVVVYEEDRFVTDLDAATFERMIKRPADYRLQGVRVEGERRSVVERFARGILRGEAHTLVNVVRQIYRSFNHLPGYSMKTRTLGVTARALRDAVKAGKGPERLLFTDLPRLFGCEPLGTEAIDPDNVARFFAGWNAAMDEISGAYEALVRRAGAVLCDSFGVAEADDLRLRAAAVLPYATEPRLQSFLAHLGETTLPPLAWFEWVSSCVMGRAPSAWADGDVERFAAQLPPLRSAFQNLELIAFERRQAPAQGAEAEPIRGLRMTVTDGGGAEAARVVVVPPAAAVRIEAMSRRLLETFETLLAGERPDVRVAVIAQVAQEILRETHDH